MQLFAIAAIHILWFICCCLMISSSQMEDSSLTRVLWYIFSRRMPTRGEADFREEILIHQNQKVPGCGAVQHMTGEVTLDMETLGKLMITISDNTAVAVSLASD